MDVSHGSPGHADSPSISATMVQIKLKMTAGVLGVVRNFCVLEYLTGQRYLASNWQYS